MQSLKEVATAADDNESVTKIDNITKGIKMRLEGSRMW